MTSISTGIRSQLIMLVFEFMHGVLHDSWQCSTIRYKVNNTDKAGPILAFITSPSLNNDHLTTTANSHIYRGWTMCSGLTAFLKNQISFLRIWNCSGSRPSSPWSTWSSPSSREPSTPMSWYMFVPTDRFTGLVKLNLFMPV